MNTPKLKLSTRYYRTLPLDNMGFVRETLELEAARTALVVLHCWDIGCEGGPDIDPDYLVGVGTLESFRTATAILRRHIRPTMDAARAAGVPVFHVEHPAIAAKYPQARDAEDPPQPPPTGPVYAPPPVVPGQVERMITRTHGLDYATKSPYARMARAKIVEPLPDEPVAHQTNQFDRLLRKRGIENLVYCGFCADMCVLRAAGGAEAMFGFGYRLFLLRDATIGIEFPDLFAERVATRWGVRYFESRLGNSFQSEEFIVACDDLQAARENRPSSSRSGRKRWR